MAGGNGLRHFMHGGAHIDPVGLRGKPVRQQRVHRRVEEDGDGTEDNHCSDGNRHFTGFGLTTGSVASTAAAPQMLLPAPISQLVCLSRPNTFWPRKQAMKRYWRRQNVNQNTAHADVGNLGERQAKAVEDDPGAADAAWRRSPPSQGCQIFG